MSRIRSLQEELQAKLDSLSERINKSASTGAADELIRIYVDRADDVRVVLEVDGKESHYEHLSDNTKFLVAYHIFQEDREHKNSLPSVLLFDEPNKGFHPSAERKMLRFLQSLADGGNQVLVTTHSQHMIDLDRLSAVRIMARAEDNTLSVDNRLHGTSGASRDILALQPVTDAIGLRYADQLVVKDKVVVVEGYTELLYLRLFAKLLGREVPNLAPVTGEGKMSTFLSLLISQGVLFKVAADSSETKSNIKKSFPVSDSSFFVVSEYLGVEATRTVGVEDLLSKSDFDMLLKRLGRTVNEEHRNSVSNSEYASSSRIKRLIAHEAHGSADLDKDSFSDETLEGFHAVFEFCGDGNWFKG